MIYEDKDQKTDEEYQFSDADLMGADASIPPLDTENNVDLEVEGKLTRTTILSSPVHRNAIIVFFGLLILYLLYRFVMWISYGGVDIPKQNKVSETPVMKVVEVPKTVSSVVPKEPIRMPPQPSSQPLPVQMENKLTSLYTEQNKMQSNVQSVMAAMTGIQTNQQQLLAKVDELTKLIAEQNAKLEHQADLIKVLEIRRAHVSKKRKHYSAPHYHQEKFYLQAVIPGRAWLIKRNGTDALTVREGTHLSGYGVVKLIDPTQGKVLTSSGRVITFGQWDS